MQILLNHLFFCSILVRFFHSSSGMFLAHSGIFSGGSSIVNITSFTSCIFFSSRSIVDTDGNLSAYKIYCFTQATPVLQTKFK